MVGKIFFILLLLVLNVVESKLQNGFDTSFDTVTVAKFKQFKAAGFTFYVQRVGRTNGLVDSNGISNLKNAFDAGYTDVGAYIFPRTISGGTPTAAQQVTNVINALQYKNVTINTLWLDIEQPDTWWPKPINKTYNRKFINDMANTAKNAGYNIGIYTGKYAWETICGADFTDYSSYPLYWSNYNKHADLTTSWKNFGGWTVPLTHQWDKDHKEFGIQFDPIVK